MRKVSPLLFITLFFFLSVMNLSSSPTTADPITNVIVQVEPLVVVDVSPGSTGMGTISGNVTCETLNTGETCSVALSADSTVGSVAISPCGMVFQGSDDQYKEILVYTSIPILTSASEDHSCTIVGVWEQGVRSGPVETDTFQIIVLPYYHPEISCESPHKKVTKGDSVSFNLNINNSGNTDDVYQVDIANRDELGDNGITFDAINKISILEQSADDIDLEVHTSSNTNEKVYDIQIIVYSILEDEPEEVEFILALEVKEDAFDVRDIFNPFFVILILVVVIVGFVVYIKRR